MISMSVSRQASLLSSPEMMARTAPIFIRHRVINKERY